jgi:thiol-disulfide isomerase/thioredoxin
MIQVLTREEVQQKLSNKETFVLDFYADWCMPCVMMGPIVEDVAEKFGKKLKVEKGFECHHWSYNDDHLTDVFILNRRDHKKVHKYLVLDIEKRMFKTIEGTILNTRELHEEYISKILNIPF